MAASPQWVPPANSDADSNQTLTYQAAEAARGAVRVFVGLGTTLLLALGIGVGVFAKTSESVAESAGQALSHVGAGAQVRDQVADAMRKANRALADATNASGAAGLGGSQTSLLTSAGVTEAFAGYKAAVGGASLKLQRLVLHDTHSSAQIQSPKDPSHIDAYRYRGGRVSEPQPVRLSGRDKKNLKRLLFDPDETPLHRLDELKTQALGQLAYEQAKISHVIVERSRGKTNFRIYVKSPRDSGHVLFNKAGKVVRVSR